LAGAGNEPPSPLNEFDIPLPDGLEVKHLSLKSTVLVLSLAFRRASLSKVRMPHATFGHFAFLAIAVE
jgi:hypothetical protein